MSEAPGPGEASRAPWRGRYGIALIALALLATIAVPVYFGGRSAVLATLQLSALDYALLFCAIACSWIARTLKLQLLLRRMHASIGFGHMFEISLATDFGFLATPAGLGGYAASVYYVRRAGASTSVAAALTAADQGTDLVFFAAALPVAGFAFFGTDLPPALVKAALGTSSALVAIALIAVLARKRLFDWAARSLRNDTGSPARQRIQHAVAEFLARLRAQARLLAGGGPAFFLAVFALTCVQWIARYGVLWLVLLLLDHRVSLALLIALQALVLHVAQWTGVPAGGGGAELGLTATLAAWVPAAALATALLLWRMVTLYLGLIAGAIAIARLSRRPRTVAAQSAPSPG